jgi:hypothetical protein
MAECGALALALLSCGAAERGAATGRPAPTAADHASVAVSTGAEQRAARPLGAASDASPTPGAIASLLGDGGASARGEGSASAPSASASADPPLPSPCPADEGRPWAKSGEAPIAPLPVRLAVAANAEGPVVDEAWLAREIAEANRLHGAHGITFAVVERTSLAAGYAAIDSAADRDAISAERAAGVINVFVVGSLRNVDAPDRFIWGVRWRLLRDVSKDYVILSAIASPTTLAHELGHLLGLDHNAIVDNVMSYRRADRCKLGFDEAQGAKLRRTARSLVSRGVLRAAIEP